MNPTPETKPTRPALACIQVDERTIVRLPGFYTTGNGMLDTRIFLALTARHVAAQSGLFS